MSDANGTNGSDPPATAERRLRAVLDTATLVLWVLDRDGRFLLSEGRGLRDIALAAGEVVGRSGFELYGGSPEVVAEARRVLAGEAFVKTAEVRGRVYEGHCRPLHEPA